MDQLWRLFIAVDIATDTRRQLTEFQASLKPLGGRVAWVHPTNVHLTLLFLGDVLTTSVADLTHALDAVATAHAPRDVTVAGAGFFGDARHPRVIWAGITDGAVELGALQEAVAVAARALGFFWRSEPFHPHLTLGRVKDARGTAPLLQAIADAGSHVFGSCRVGELLLFRSTLAAAGAEYTLLHRAPLTGADSAL